MNIIITGASSGIGKALKEYYEKKGNVVFDISRSGDGYQCDITNRKGLETVFNDIASKVEKIDMLINCAGFGGSGAIELMPIDKVQSIYDVNVIGTINCIQLTLPLMGNRGKIINIASAMGLYPIPFRGFYASAKSAIIALSDSLRMELSQTKIQVTAICPSDIKTNFTQNRLKDYETNQRYGDAVALSTQAVDGREEKRMSLNKAIKIMTRWINKRHLKPLYIMTFKYKLLYFAKGIFPKSLYQKACNKLFFKKRKKRA